VHHQAGQTLADLDVEQLRVVEVCDPHRLSSFSPTCPTGCRTPPCCHSTSSEANFAEFHF
jgi:hypothetical protein